MEGRRSGGNHQLGPYLEPQAWIGAMSPRRLFAFLASGYLRTAGQELQWPPKKWQLALGTLWASAFSCVPRELVGRTDYCLACDHGRLPGRAEGRR